MTVRTTRRAVVVAAAAALTGCSRLPFVGDEVADRADETEDDPLAGDASKTSTLELTSSAFDDGGLIPAEYGRDERDVNPPLEIDGVPDDAESLLLLVDDPDAERVTGKVWLHWLVWNVPPDTREIPEDWDPGQSGAVEGENDFEEVGYGGPDPPNEIHTYRFKLYALDATLDLERGATRDEVSEAAAGRVLEQTQLTGTYEP